MSEIPSTAPSPNTAAPAGPRARVLVVDDEANARTALRDILRDEGYEVAEAGDGEQALQEAEAFAPAVILADLRMPKLDGLDLLGRLRERGSTAKIVVMTAHGSVSTAVRAMKLGADDYLTKPLDADELLVVLGKVLDRRALEREAENLRERAGERASFDRIVGRSPEMQAVFDLVVRAAPTKATILIAGESGTGKELVAEAMHARSPRARGAFVKVNCGALPETLLESELFGHEKGSFTGAVSRREGRFEAADHGTLFLDEIGDIPPPVQLRLLRFLQSREFERVGGNTTYTVDVRVIAATHRDLTALVKEGKFREDLFYRLNVVTIEVPPLRARKSDLPLLVDHFVRKFARQYERTVKGLVPAALQAVLGYEWPGNVRELENALERAVVLCDGTQILPANLPPAVATRVQPEGAPAAAGVAIPGSSMAEIEREAILKTLDAVGGSTVQAAQILGISVRKIQYRLREWGLRNGKHEPEASADTGDGSEPSK
jgi:two-component system NtrC family response regulator/two-component system response regulator HydG